MSLYTLPSFHHPSIPAPVAQPPRYYRCIDKSARIPRATIRTEFTEWDGDGRKQTNQLPLSVVQPLGFIHHNFNWFLQVRNTGRQAYRPWSIGDICTDFNINGLRNTYFHPRRPAGEISGASNYIYFYLSDVCRWVVQLAWWTLRTSRYTICLQQVSGSVNTRTRRKNTVRQNTKTKEA